MQTETYVAPACPAWKSESLINNNMKNIRLILCVIAALVSVNAFAQENNNRDAEGKIVRGPYETNKFGDNWFIGAQGGINVFLDRHEGYGFSNLTPSLDINAGKWFTPCTGMRIGYHGIMGAQDASKVLGNNSSATYREEFSFAYFHGDLLWNVSNAIGGYKETRFWNFIPYVHAGYLRLYDIEDETNAVVNHTNPYDNEWAMGAGLLNNLRLHSRVNLTFDLRYMLFSARFHDWAVGGRTHELAALVGISYNLGKTNWTRTSSTAMSLAAAEAALAAANEQILALKNAPKEIVEVVKEVPVQVKGDGDTELVPLALGIPPITLFYEINSTELNVTERQHLRFYVENILNRDPNRKFYLTGSADAGTGTQSINERLSKGRVENVIKILTEEFGISKDRLILQGTKITDEAPDPRLDRSVIIVH